MRRSAFGKRPIAKAGRTGAPSEQRGPTFTGRVWADPVLDAEDTVVGTVHVKNAVALPVHERPTTRVKHLMVKPIVVPDTLRLDPLLALLRKDKEGDGGPDIV